MKKLQQTGMHRDLRELPRKKKKNISRRATGPSQEISEILGDVLALDPWWADLAREDWKCFSRYAPGVADALARDFIKYSGLFRERMRIDGADFANAISVLIAYCAAADNAIVEKRTNEAWSNTIAAARWHGIVLALHSFWQHEDIEQKAARQSVASSGARAKLSKDPKQLQKTRIRELWTEWQSGGKRYRSTAKFALDVYQAAGLENPITVTRWCREWAKELKSQRETY